MQIQSKDNNLNPENIKKVIWISKEVINNLNFIKLKFIAMF